MHAVIVSHAAIKSANRRVYRALAQRDCRVTLLIPDRWKSGLGPLRAEPEPGDSGLDVRVRRRLGIAHSNLYWLDGKIAPLLDDGPAAIFVDEDPAGVMVAQAARAARARKKGLLLLGIQNIYKRYPAPFELLQMYAFRCATGSLSNQRCGTNDLAAARLSRIERAVSLLHGTGAVDAGRTCRNAHAVRPERSAGGVRRAAGVRKKASTSSSMPWRRCPASTASSPATARNARRSKNGRRNAASRNGSRSPARSARKRRNG